MTLTFEHVLDRVKENQQAERIGQSSFRSKVIARTRTHTRPSSWHGPLRIFLIPLLWVVCVCAENRLCLG